MPVIKSDNNPYQGTYQANLPVAGTESDEPEFDVCGSPEEQAEERKRTIEMFRGTPLERALRRGDAPELFRVLQDNLEAEYFVERVARNLLRARSAERDAEDFQSTASDLSETLGLRPKDGSRIAQSVWQEIIARAAKIEGAVRKAVWFAARQGGSEAAIEQAARDVCRRLHSSLPPPDFAMLELHFGRAVAEQRHREWRDVVNSCAAGVTRYGAKNGRR